MNHWSPYAMAAKEEIADHFAYYVIAFIYVGLFCLCLSVPSAGHCLVFTAFSGHIHSMMVPT